MINRRQFARELSVVLLGTAALSVMTGAARAEEQTVKIDNFAFTPQVLTIKAGTAVTWVNHDDIPHSVASEVPGLRSKALDTDQSFTFTFATPGTYKYFCGLHPHMTGSIVVQ